MRGRIWLAAVVSACLLSGADFFPLAAVRPGLKGSGKTVFSGTRIEEFQVEILGVLENVGPKQSLVLARLSGGPLDNAGVLQGMSGSPVYIEGKLLGAVAMAFPFAKEPVAAIRPIEELLRASGPDKPSRRLVAALRDGNLAKVFEGPQEVPAGGGRLVEIATPVHFGGFTPATIEHFAPQLRALGLEPRQGLAGGGSPTGEMGDPSLLQPGAMITVQLLAGDMSLGADGTVTHIEGDRLYAFGHRFLSLGATELPFARAEVLTVLPNLASSFKISAAREWMGTITEDRSTAVAGVLGRRASMVPVSIEVRRRAASGISAESRYRMEMVRDRFLAPFLLQMALYSAIDATERMFGSATIGVAGEIRFHNGTEPLRLKNMYAGEFSLPQQVSLATVVPLAYALQTAETLELKDVRLELDAYDQKKQMQIDQVWVRPRQVRPGDEVEVTVSLVSGSGLEVTRKASYLVPVGMPEGPLYFTVADGATTNLSEYRQLLGGAPRSATQLLQFLNSLRANTKAYVRVWRPQPSYQAGGEEFPSPPPSLAQILARGQTALGPAGAGAGSKVAELEISAGDVVISGSKTVQVEVKE